jgi:hypothetical protein
MKSHFRFNWDRASVARYITTTGIHWSFHLRFRAAQIGCGTLIMARYPLLRNSVLHIYYHLTFLPFTDRLHHE